MGNKLNVHLDAFEADSYVLLDVWVDAGERGMMQFRFQWWNNIGNWVG